MITMLKALASSVTITAQECHFEPEFLAELSDKIKLALVNSNPQKVS